jgi:hypothetical protein
VIGGYAPGSQSQFEGLVDEVRLFSRALGVEEIAAQHRALAPAAPQPSPAP